MKERFQSPEKSSFIDSKVAQADNSPRDYHYLDDIKGQVDLYRAVFQEHFRNILPVIHFTTVAAGNDLNNLKDTGFLKSFSTEGNRGKLHVGALRTQDNNRNFRNIDVNTDNLGDIIQMIRDIAIQFMHHGRRTNKNSLGNLRGSNFAQPVAIIFDSDGQFTRGTDNYFHWILKNSYNPDKIIELLEFEAGVASKYYEPSPKTQNQFVMRFLHALGIYRLKQLVGIFHSEENSTEREKIKNSSRGLLRARLITDKEFKDAFEGAPSLYNQNDVISEYAA